MVGYLVPLHGVSEVVCVGQSAGDSWFRNSLRYLMSTFQMVLIHSCVFVFSGTSGTLVLLFLLQWRCSEEDPLAIFESESAVPLLFKKIEEPLLVLVHNLEDGPLLVSVELLIILPGLIEKTVDGVDEILLICRPYVQLSQVGFCSLKKIQQGRAWRRIGLSMDK